MTKCEPEPELREHKLLTEDQASALFNGEAHTDDRLVIYWTEGQSYMVASNGIWNDDNLPHDLVLINRYGTAMAVSPLTNPDLVAEVQQVITSSMNLVRMMEEEEAQ